MLGKKNKKATIITLDTHVEHADLKDYYFNDFLGVEHNS
jgi:hypothetical protein